MEIQRAISATQIAPTDGIPMPRRLGAILAVAFGVSLSVLDGSIANVALPTIGRELGISPADSIWIVNAYQLAIMISILSLSALGDLVGYRKVYIAGLMLFTVASMGCALSESLQSLVLSRVMQGFGLFQSPNNSILIASAPPERSGSASGMLATARLLGQTTGAALMALLFHFVPGRSTHAALLLAGGFVCTGAVVSFTRVRLPLPEALRRKKGA